MNSIAIEGSLRTSTGKKSTKALRNEGLVPCVIYGGDTNVHFTAPAMAFRDLIYTPNFNLAEVKVDGEVHKCILKSADFHPVTDSIVHIDFLRLVPGKSIKVNLPVHFQGVAPGVKEGGAFIKKLRMVSVKTTPEVLVDALYADISELKLGFSIRVKDINLPEGMEIMNPLTIPIASVEVPRALKSLEAEEEEAAAAAAAAAEGAEEETAAAEA